MQKIKWAILFAALAGFTAVAYADDDHTDGWKDESSAGVVVTSGNTDTSTLNFADVTSYKFSENLFKISAGYFYQKTSDTVSGKNWNLGIRYERILNEKIGVFLGEKVEGDRFSGIEQRYSTDIGAKYLIAKSDTLTWSGEGGYRYSKENRLEVSRSLSYARLYTEVEKKFDPTVSAKYWIEYLPNFTDSNDWQLNTEASVVAAISTYFSLKSAFLLKYDNEVNAPGLLRIDRSFTTSLVAKF